MSRKCKTPAALANVIMHRHPDTIAHLEEMLRVKRSVPADSQGEHIRSRTEAEMIAFTNGYSACLEAVMHEFNCYAGFHNYGPQVGNARHAVNQESPDFQEWRRLYYTNGVQA